MAVVLFVLCSAVFDITSTSSRLRQINCTETPHSREGASEYCHKTQSKVITLYDAGDANFSRKLMQRISEETPVTWLGLRRDRKSNSTWSDNSSYAFNLSNVNLKDKEQICEAIDGNKWIGHNCSERKPFMCRSRNNSYVLVEEERTWCQARQHCTRRHKDLVSISNATENDQVIERGMNRSFWIGLLHDGWEWEDNGCSTFREWNPGRPGKCTVQSKTSSPSLSTHGCSNFAKVLCSKGSVRIKVVRKRLTWGKAFDYCHAYHTRLLWIEGDDDQRAVELWLKHSDVTGPLWLGLRQSRVFGFWFWSSDRTVDHNNWKGGVPPEPPMSYHCGAIDKMDNCEWTDRDCRLELPFLCEEDIPMM